MPELTSMQYQPPEGKDTHWLIVGYVSPGAHAWIEELGGHVIQLSAHPPFIAVGLVYDPKGAWVWSHGRQEHRDGIEFWSNGEIQEASTGINLLCPRGMEYRSVDTNYLILPDEEFDETTGQVKDPSSFVPIKATASIESDDSLGDLDDHPF